MNVKTVGKKALALLLALVLSVGLLVSESHQISASAITPSELTSRFNSVKNGTYGVGKYFRNNQSIGCCRSDTGAACHSNHSGFNYTDDSFCNCKVATSDIAGTTGGIQCFGYARYVFYQLFRQSIATAYSDRYKLANTTNVTLVGQTSSNNADNSSSILSKGLMGDFIQASYGSNGMHSMIVESVSSNGITVLECNHDGNCHINTRSLSFYEFGNQYSRFSLYRSTNHPGSSAPSSARIDINPNGGTAVDSFYVNYGEKCNLTIDSAWKPGYALDGWNLYRPADGKWFVGGKGWYTGDEISANGYTKQLYNPNLSMTLDSSWYSNCSTSVSVFTFFAVWKEGTYKININPNGGTASTASLSLKYNQKCNLSPSFVLKNGYELAGWNLYRPADGKWFVGGKGWYTEAEISANGYTKQQYIPNLSMTLDSSWFGNCATSVSMFTFVAVWKEGTYTVNINANGGTASTTSLSVKYNTQCSIGPDIVQKTGYHLAGWNLYRPADNKWFAKGQGWYTASEINANGYTILQYEPDLSMKLDSSWFRNCNTSVSTFTFYAVWAQNTYTVKFNGNGATSGTMQDQTFTYDVAQNLTANAFQRKYTVTYNYNGYNGATGGNSATNATATAAFNGWATSASGAKVYNDKASVKNLAASGTYNLYANWTLGTITLPSPTRTGYIFDGWYTDSALTKSAGAAGASYKPTANTTLYAKWTADSLTKIAVKSMPNKTTYYVDETLNTNGLTLTATYSDGSTNTVSSGFTCTPTKLSTAGTQTITVSYGGKTATFTVTVVADAVKSLAVKTQPTKTSYYVGDTLNTAGLTLTATYNSGKTETVSSGFTCLPTKLNTAGTQTITVSYGGKTATFTVAVTADAVKSLAVKTQPTKTSYYVGDTLNTAGLTLTATYNSGKTETVSSGFTCSPTKLNTAGTQTITVSYGGKTVTFTVTVTADAVKSIAIKTNPTKTSYFVGDTLNTAGLTLTATYNSGKTETVTSGFTCTPTKLSTAGTQTITVSYGGKTATFTVTVTADAVKSLAIKTQPTKTSYYVGDTLNTAGLTLTATYNSGKTETVTSGFTCTPTKLNTAGTQTVTVNYGGKSTTFNVTVVADAIKSIAIKTQANNLSYYVGDTLNTAGLTLTATYNSGKKETINEGFDCDPMVLNAIGQQNITITYAGKTATFSVTVASKPVSSHTVTFKVDGKVYHTATYEVGTAIQLPTPPAKYGHIFREWTPALPPVMPDHDLTVTAQFDAVTYNAVFIADGVTVGAVPYTLGDAAVQAPAVPEKPGYTGKWSDYTLAVGGVTVYAVYTPITFVVPLIVDGKQIGEVLYTYGQTTLDLPPVPEKPGYTGKWDYTLTASGADVKALYTPIVYQANFVADGAIVKTVNYTVETASITPPAVPAKEGYTGKWEDYTLAVGGVTVNAIYAKIDPPTPVDATVSIRNFTASRTVDYKTTITFTAVVTDAPAGAAVHWFIDGRDVGTGETYKKEKATASYTVQAKLMQGSTVLAESEVETVQVNTGFFARIIAFFRNLFGSLPVIIQTIKETL